MILVRGVATAVYFLLVLYFLSLFARLVLDIARTALREWRPRGAGLVAAEVVYAATDPPLRLFRRVVPPVRVGPVAFDLAWTITMLLCVICMWIVFRLV